MASEEKKRDAKRLILDLLQRTDPICTEGIYLELGRAVPVAALRECLGEMQMEQQLRTYNGLYFAGHGSTAEVIQTWSDASNVSDKNGVSTAKLIIVEHLLGIPAGSLRLRSTLLLQSHALPVSTLRACLLEMLPRPKDADGSEGCIFDGSVDFFDGIYCVNSEVARYAVWTAEARKLGGDKAAIIVDKAEAKGIILNILGKRRCPPMNAGEIHKKLKAVVPLPVLHTCLKEMVNSQFDTRRVSVSNGFYFVDHLENQQIIMAKGREKKYPLLSFIPLIAAAKRKTRANIFESVPLSVFAGILDFLSTSTRVVASGTDKLLRHMNFRVSPLMWAEMRFRVIADNCLDENQSVRLTDNTLRSFLKNTNAVEVTKIISLAGCKAIKGGGLDALKGSTVLEEIDCRCHDGVVNEKKVIAVLETMPPFSFPANQHGYKMPSSSFSLRKVEFMRRRYGGRPFLDRFDEPVRSFLVRFSAHLGEQIVEARTPCSTCSCALIDKCSEAELRAEPGKARCSECDKFSCGNGTCPKINFCLLCNNSPCSKCEDIVSCEKCSASCQSCCDFSSCVDCERVMCDDCNEDEEDQRIQHCAGDCEGGYCDRCRFVQYCDACNERYCTICRPLDDWKACAKCNDILVCGDCTSEALFCSCLGCETECCEGCCESEGIHCDGGCNRYCCSECEDQIRYCEQCCIHFCPECITDANYEDCEACCEALLLSQNQKLFEDA